MVQRCLTILTRRCSRPVNVLQVSVGGVGRVNVVGIHATFAGPPSEVNVAEDPRWQQARVFTGDALLPYPAVPSSGRGDLYRLHIELTPSPRVPLVAILRLPTSPAL